MWIRPLLTLVCVASAGLATCGPVPAAPAGTSATCADSGSAGRATVPVEPLIDAPPAGTSNGTLLALDARTGTLRWRRELPMATASLRVTGARVIVKGSYGTTGGVYAAVERATGDLAWRWPGTQWLQAQNFDTVVAGDGVVAAQGFGLTVLDARTGTPRWGLDRRRGGFGTAISSGVLVTPAAPAGRTTATRHTTRLVARDACTGTPRWTTRGRALRDVAIPVGTRTAVTAYVHLPAPSQRSAVVQVEGRTGRENWRTTLPGTAVTSFFAPVTGPATLIGFSGPGGPRGNTRLALDPRTGHRLWQHSDHTFWFPPEQADQHAYYLSDTNRVEARAALTGRRQWSAQFPGIAAGIAAGGGLLIVGTAQGAVAVAARTGQPRWRVRLDPNANGVAFGGAAVAGHTVYLWSAGTPLLTEE
jgi:outer membrane protein assembly factor BamB